MYANGNAAVSRISIKGQLVELYDCQMAIWSRQSAIFKTVTVWIAIDLEWMTMTSPIMHASPFRSFEDSNLVSLHP
jgi:hypothetical protein